MINKTKENLKETMMKLGHIEILVEDPKRSQQFYCDVLGFELVTIQNELFFWLKKGQQEFLIRPGRRQEAPSQYENAPVGFVLYTDNVEESLAELKRKGVEIRGTVDSIKCFTFTDPDGNWFQLVNPNDH
jgi:catechol 2,3-dioxygenase-like lactoylglutathione lyase family enzyme